MKPMTRVYILDDEGQRIFGEGPCQLLLAVEELGSLRAAAQSMGMAYTKALKILNRAEQTLGCSLICRQAGGKNGGGSRLTAQGKEVLERYAAFRDQCVQANRQIYQTIFGAGL